MKKVVLFVLFAVLTTGLMTGCVNSKLNTFEDSKGWHLRFEGANTTAEKMYPVEKGMKVQMVSKLESGELRVFLVINGKEVFNRSFNGSEVVNYTIPATGDCLVKINMKKAKGSFDFLM